MNKNKKRELSDKAYLSETNLAMATDCGFRDTFLELRLTVIREHAIETLKEVIRDLENENDVGLESDKVYKSVYSASGDDMGDHDHMLNLTPKLGEGWETTLQELIKLENHRIG